MQVLLVAEARAPRPEWAGRDGSSFDLSRTTSVAEAAARLATCSAHVVIVDARVAAAEAGELTKLRERLGHAALLVQADDYTPEIPLLVEQLGGSACMLPTSAPADVQAQLVRFSAERARLATALTDRDAELEQSESRFRDVIERNADAILVVDRDGAIRFANAVAAELFRSPRDSLVGRSFGFPMVAGETTELDLFHSGQPRVVEMRVVESEWEGETAYIASLRDITERKRAEEDARRLIREQTARAAAETAARRFRFQAEASTLLSFPLDYASTLSTLAQLCVAGVADWAVIYVVDQHGEVQRLEVSHRDPAKAEAVRAIREHPIDPEGNHPVLEVLRSRSPRIVADVDDERLATIAQDAKHLELMRELGVASFMFVPLVARGNVLGAMGLISSDPERRFTDDDLAEANDLALRAALALDNARLYREARDANEAKTNLLAVISHDLRTPLNSIIGHADLLSMGIPDRLSKAGLERVERIRVGATHLVYLIDELLSFARLDAGYEELHRQDVDLAAVARDVAVVVEPLATERGLAFHLDVPASPVSLCTDPDCLRRVLLNLVGNALKYTEAGEVRLELCLPTADRVEFRVRDTGIGILPEHLGKIFEPFWQVDTSRRAADGGTGLGLSVVQRLVRLLGGDVAVESAAGLGSVFTVCLPHPLADEPSPCPQSLIGNPS